MAYLVHASLIAVVLMVLGGEGQKPAPCVYEWTPFLPWTPCSVSCGQGYQTRTRYCVLQQYPCTDPTCEGLVAGKPITSVPSRCCSPGSNIETRECYGAVNGNWSEWGCWGECINGTRQRHRICNNPIPTGWGNYCVGNHTETEKCGCAAGQDVVFVIDRSWSIGQSNYNSMVNQVNSVIQSFDLDTGSGPLTTVRVGIELFNSNQFDLKHLNNFVLPATPYPYGGLTDIAAAISFAHNTMFTVPNGDRIQAPNTMVLITDGHATNPIPAATAATAAKNDGIEIMAIGVGDDVNVAHLEGIVSDPSTDLYLPNDFCSIASILKTMFNCPEYPAESERIRKECAEIASDDSEAKLAPQEREDLMVESPR